MREGREELSSVVFDDGQVLSAFATSSRTSPPMLSSEGQEVQGDVTNLLWYLNKPPVISIVDKSV
jgi:hypothetical protein